MTKIFIACDHAAFEAKEVLRQHLLKAHEVIDLGTHSAERCDYPDYAVAVARKVQAGEGIGILLCGSGIGVSLVANRFAGVRAALCRTPYEAELSRQHNNANILCLGARINNSDEIKAIAEAWLIASFEGGRHAERIAMFDSLGEKA
jgi:ribose 5-phosphate isomerase B